MANIQHCQYLVVIRLLYCIYLQGIACDIKSTGFKHLHNATIEVIGASNPYSDCGSLPLVSDLQKAGFDVQVYVI